MLATTHTVSLLVRTLQDALIAPWGYWQTGAAVLVLAMLGLVQMLWRDRSALAHAGRVRSVRTSFSTCSFRKRSRRATRFRSSFRSRISRSAARRSCTATLRCASRRSRSLRRRSFVDDARSMATRRCTRRRFACSATCTPPPRRGGTGRPAAGAGDAPERGVRHAPADSVGRRRDADARRAPAGTAQARVARAGEVLERRRRGPGLVRRRSAAKRSRARSRPTPPDALSMAVPLHDARRRRPAERNGLARRSTRPTGISARAGR